MIKVKEDLLKRTKEALALIKTGEYEEAQAILEKLEKDSEASVISARELLNFSEKTVIDVSMMMKFVEETIKSGGNGLSIEQQLKQLNPKIDVTIIDEPRISFWVRLKKNLGKIFGKRKEKETDEYDLGGEE